MYFKESVRCDEELQELAWFLLHPTHRAMAPPPQQYRGCGPLGLPQNRGAGSQGRLHIRQKTSRHREGVDQASLEVQNHIASDPKNRCSLQTVREVYFFPHTNNPLSFTFLRVKFRTKPSSTSQPSRLFTFAFPSPPRSPSAWLCPPRMCPLLARESWGETPRAQVRPSHQHCCTRAPEGTVYKAQRQLVSSSTQMY